MLRRLTEKIRGDPDAARRSAMLRGVYEENLRLDAPRAPGGRPRRPRRARWLAAFAIPAVVALVAYLTVPLAPDPSPVDRPDSASATAARGPAGGHDPGARPAAAPDAPVAPVAPARPPIELVDVLPLPVEQERLGTLLGLSVRTVVIDAGHGGRDSGAIGRGGIREKDITLDIARRLRDKLDSREGFRVLLVRDEDVFVPLRARADFANTHDADLFVSIHVNFLPGTSINAVETYYFGRHQDERTRRLAERENEDSGYSLSEFESLMQSMQDTIKLQESRALAHAIQDSLLRRLRAHEERVLDNGVRTAPFVVLLGVKVPSVLVEVGSLSSLDAENRLRSTDYRDEIASHVAEGISNYLNAQFPVEEKVDDQETDGLAGKR